MQLPGHQRSLGRQCDGQHAHCGSCRSGGRARQLARLVAAAVPGSPGAPAAEVQPIVGDVMNREVLTLSEDNTVRDAIMQFLQAGISGAPVVDSTGRLVGVISETDIILEEPESERDGGRPMRYGPMADMLMAMQGGMPGGGADLQRLHEFLGLTVGEVMTSSPVSCSPSNLAVEAAATMVAAQVNRLPVTDEDGMVVGIITRGDVLQAMIFAMLATDEAAAGSA